MQSSNIIQYPYQLLICYICQCLYTHSVLHNLQLNLSRRVKIHSFHTYLHKFVTLPSNRFILSNGKICQHRVVSNVRCIAVSLDIYSPFTAIQRHVNGSYPIRPCQSRIILTIQLPNVTFLIQKMRCLQSGQVSMPCSDVFGLEMLKLRIDVEPVTSLLKKCDTCQNLQAIQL